METRKEIRELHRMACPILCHYVLTSLFEMFDQAIIGQNSTRGFALVGIASVVLYGVTGALGMLSSAFHILAAEKKGEQDESGFWTVFLVSRELVIWIGCGFFILSLMFGRGLFQSIYKIRGNELRELLSYFYPASITVLENLLIFQYSVYFRNQKNTRIALVVTGISTVVNLWFDFVLVYGAAGFPHMGTAGAAWGSVIGLGCGVFIYQVAYWKEIRKNFRPCRVRGVVRRKVLQKIGKLYFPLLGQDLFENTIFVFFVSVAAARLGSEEMAIYKLLDLIGGILELPIYAYAAAAQTYVLQSNAAGDDKKARQYQKAGIRTAAMVVLAASGVCKIFSDSIFCWIIADQKIIDGAAGIFWMPAVILMIKVFYRFEMLYLQGIGKERFVFWNTVAASILAGVGVLWAGMSMGLPGIYLGIFLQYGILAIRYIRQKKGKNDVVSEGLVYRD